MITTIQELIAKRATLIDEVVAIEDKILAMTKQQEEFDIDVYCETHKQEV